MDTALLIWDRVVSQTGIFTKLISDRDLIFTSALSTNHHQLIGTNLSFSTAYHPQTDVLSKRMIQTLEDMVIIFCSYGLELKDCDVSTHDSPGRISLQSSAIEFTSHRCQHKILLQSR
ncbi:hypothetical protein O181_115970 [Austropuccinia psidii MF-1]|uniref:Integrase catalytic domain-containing protein n=1 Tax=Austropuccinia psidii MF-1 TaxID=1389203 RepID=A0A9Q3K7H2_9BASI|nr:hypothetical protein [Austropuccinia psidii MF-1]